MITQNGNMAQCLVTVKRSITSLAVSPTSKTLIVGQTLQLSKTINPSNTTEGTVWTSSNNSVATVTSSGGFVTAKGVGTATITLKSSESNVSASCVVTVTAGGYIIGLGDTQTGSNGSVKKLNSNGKLLWSYTENLMRCVNSVAQTSDGGYIIGLGDTETGSNGSVKKLDSNGKLLWSYTENLMRCVNSVTQTY